MNHKENYTFLKRITVAFMIISMIFSFLPVQMLAAPVEGEVAEDAIYISTPEELISLAENCVVNTWSVGKTVVLSNDIDVSGASFAGIPTFGGTFLGQGYKITGLSLTQDGSVVGFFRYVQSGAIIDNLHIKGILQPEGSKSIVGGIAGENKGTIKNSSFDGLVTGYQYVGGLVGINDNSGIIDNSISSGTIFGSHFVGGVAGVNKGVLRRITNNASVNTEHFQNSVEIEDITMESLTNTEDASTATDIGGIVGNNSGVVRDCINAGVVGYRSMGYNVGGIAGSQNGYMVNCINQASVSGRKEVGGIVGHMEPNIVLDYDEDSLQMMSNQLESVNANLSDIQYSMETGTEDVSNQMDSFNNNIDAVQENIEIITAETEKEHPDQDVITAAMNAMGDSMSEALDEATAIQESTTNMTSDVSSQFEGVIQELDAIITTAETADENMGLSIQDISGEDTEEHTSGKVSNCVNYGEISGDQNIGGIAGIMAKETDLDAYEDVNVTGETSLNGSYETRTVICDCKNFGKISVNKQNAGGITGQMDMGAVLESTNLGNLNCINADYVGGIVGQSTAIVRNCSSRSQISGDTYVGGIAGMGNEVMDCYAFVSMEHYSEKAGGILGQNSKYPDKVQSNYYFIVGNVLGGIDGISYTSSAEMMDMNSFLQLPELAEELKTVEIHFYIENAEEIIKTLPTGGTLSMDELPVMETEENSEYSWEVIPAVTSEVLEMGETEIVDYISEERLTNILFNQYYRVSYDLKNTVIQAEERNENNLAVLLANGTFAKNTTLKMKNVLGQESQINGIQAKENWSIQVSNTGITKLHYLLDESLEPNFIKLYVKDKDGNWIERDYIIDGSYMVFDFTDGEQGFALVEDFTSLMLAAGAAVVLLIVIGIVVIVLKKQKH